MPDADAMPSPDDDENLPASLPEEKMQPLMEKFTAAARRIGLNPQAIALNLDKSPEPGDEAKHSLIVQFEIGDRAFSVQVQDPETDKMNDQFRKIARADVDDEIDRIRRQYEDGEG